MYTDVMNRLDFNHNSFTSDCFKVVVLVKLLFVRMALSVIPNMFRFGCWKTKRMFISIIPIVFVLYCRL